MDERSIKKILDSPPERIRESCKRYAMACSRRLRRPGKFSFRGADRDYFYHTYNLAWRNERSVEIPIVQEYLNARRGQNILEVGNVLSHYMNIDHAIIDKYEVAEGVINEDVVDFSPEHTYDLILSVSTLEHVGEGESAPGSDKSVRAVSNLKRLLSPDGELVFTVPLGLNPSFDSLLTRGKIPVTELFALRRTRFNRWVQTDFESVKSARYSRFRFRANALVVGVLREGQTERADDLDKP